MKPWVLQSMRPGLFLATIGAPTFSRWYFEALAASVVWAYRERP